MKLPVLTIAALAMSATALTACARTPQPAGAPASATAATAANVSETSASATGPTPVAQAVPARPQTPASMVVHKSASCGCCGLWVDHMREAGFAIEVRNADNINPVKEQVGVPLGKGSCHTAQVGDYFIEGHVPAEDVKRLLAERPDAKGLVLPGMPMGSPGMEMPDGRTQPFTVELVNLDGTATPFAEH